MRTPVRGFFIAEAVTLRAYFIASLLFADTFSAFSIRLLRQLTATLAFFAAVTGCPFFPIQLASSDSAITGFFATFPVTITEHSS